MSHSSVLAPNAQGEDMRMGEWEKERREKLVKKKRHAKEVML